MYFKFDNVVQLLLAIFSIPLFIVTGIAILVGLALIIRHLFEPHRLIFPWVLVVTVADIILVALAFPIKAGMINIFGILAIILTVGILIYGLLLTVTDIDDEDFWWSRY